MNGPAFTRTTAGALRARIGFLTETPGLWDNLTVADNLRVYAKLFGVTRPDLAAERVLRMFELWDRRADPVAPPFQGMEQKLRVARRPRDQPDGVFLCAPT